MKKIKRRLKVFVGPKNNLPSFSWVAEDIFKKLSNEFEIIYFDKYTDIFFQKDINITFLIKLPPPMWFIFTAILMDSKLVYIPIDFLGSEYQIKKNFLKIKIIKNILTHNNELKRALKKYTKSIYSIEHYNKYPVKRNLETNNSILWVGHVEYIPTLLKHLKLIDYNKYGLKLTLLTDVENILIKKQFLKDNLEKIEIECIKDESIYLNGYKFIKWTEQLYLDNMKSCAFAIDFKENEFHHKVKPPTKSQIYISNEVPLGINKNCYINTYYTNMGFELADYRDINLLLSNNYRQHTNALTKKISSLTLLNNVAKSYRDLIYKINSFPFNS